MPILPKLSSEDLKFMSQTFGVKDQNGDQCLTWFHDTGDQDLIKTLASANYQSASDAIETEDVFALRETLENNPVIKGLIHESAVYRMPLALLTRLDQAEGLIDQQRRDYVAAHDNWNPFDDTIPYKSVYDLSESGDYRDEWLLTTIMGVTEFLWPDIQHGACDTTKYLQEVCNTSRALATKIVADNGQPFDGRVQVGTEHVIPQLKQAIYDRY